MPVIPITPARHVPAAAMRVAPVASRAPLHQTPLIAFPAGSIRPRGWLERQLRIQANGMGGRLDEVWGDVGQTSGWLGGPGEKWERGPYFLDGLLPLAWALGDARLKAKAQAFIDWTLASARPDGMFGPADNDDWWPRMVMLKVLAQYHELTGDPRVIPLLTGYFHYQLVALPTRPLRDWGRFRWQDEALVVLWLYNRTGDPKLLDLAALLKEQGWDWRSHFAAFPFRRKATAHDLGLDERPLGAQDASLRDRALSGHGVNTAMGVKAGAVWSQLSGDVADRAAAAQALAVLDRYHGLPIGMFSADEHFAGRSPSQGVELCAVVEMLFSLEQALAASGDTAFADRIERIAYNALPAAFTDDMWAHQYDQQPNQIKCSHGPGPWTTNGPEANLFGLEPHFGCCTANFHQGWPKLLGHVFMATSDGGVATTIYAPARLETMIGDVPIAAELTTEYPFRDSVALVLTPERPVRFPLKLRVPGWAEGVTVHVNDRAVPVAAQDGFVTLDRSWKRGDRVQLNFAIPTRVETGFNGSASVAHGALLYALPVGERWEKLKPHGLAADWQVFPTTPWNYGLAADSTYDHEPGTPGRVPFGRDGVASFVLAKAARVSAWQGEGNWAAPPPQSPVAGAGMTTSLRLVPYAAAKLRIVAFPVVTG